MNSEIPWDRLKMHVVIAFQNHYYLQDVAQEISNKFAVDENYTHWCMIIKKADFKFDAKLKIASIKFNRYFEFDINKNY